MLVSSQLSRQSVLLEGRRKTDLERRASQLLPKTSLHLPSSCCRLKRSNISQPQLVCLWFPKEMRHTQSRCSPALPSPSHNNLPERKEHLYGGWVKNKGARCHPPPGTGRAGQESTSGRAARLPGKRVPICQAGWDRRATAAGDGRREPTGVVGTAAPAQGAPSFPGGEG